MPTFRLDGPARDYPFARDALGQNLGRVEPGDEREFDTAPDQWWVPADGGAGPHEHPGFGDTPMHGTEGAPDGTFSEIGGEAPGGGEGAAEEPQPAA